ncbi:agmatinase [Thomasclavelia cocleata]|uniref:Agmatinase n=1 Tax=Thomasclavelia cocleata TaxID=69824 RepID=A0A1I0F8Q5_9FIRM|nr:agmatinase [Thomasclavelia cocleata]MCR1960583.1 agmatinase [Thomasclavelia cocleata]NDO41274.1 agmatinase [Thomasclavelia cocleata]PJN80337.1 agmatinase [Thomasclavelia cocleata]SET53494.1 agmatinase [Thomasclavelia cocleata]
MWNKNIQTFIGLEASFDEAKCVIFGAPMDSTTSYRPGTRFASSAMRQESFGIETYSPYQDKDLEDIKVFDGGDLELPFGNPRKSLDMIQETIKTILEANKLPCMIGGEHLVTLGAIEAVVEKYPDLRIIHFDAHTDLRDEYLGEKLSHASVIRRVHDIVGNGKIHQFGIRSGERDEFYWAKEHTNLNKFNFKGLQEAIEECQNYPVYFTIDLDVLDPSVFPGTGTPEAGGVTFIELLEAIIAVSKLNVVAMDINELSPVYDQSGASTALACKVLRELLLAMNKGEE